MSDPQAQYNNVIKNRCRPNFRNSKESSKDKVSCRDNSNYFPLRFQSKDHLSISGDYHDANHDVYLQLLQEASSPTTESNRFDVISPDIVNKLDKTQGAAPIHYACINGNLPMLLQLLKNGAQVDIWDACEKVTPLICAAAHGHLDIIEILLQHGCNVDAGLNGAHEGQHCALLWAVRGNKSKVVQCLLENNGSQYSTVPFSETPLHAAVISDSPEILQMLLDKQNKRIKSDFQMGLEKSTPLHLAVSQVNENSFQVCKILLENGKVDVNSLNAKQKTPLHEAVSCHNMDIINLLLTHGARLNAVDEEGKTPLFYAITSGDKESSSWIITSLVERATCNVNHQDNCGNTPLHFAGLEQDAGAVEILLMNGGDFSIKNGDGVSALSLLRKNIPTTYSLLKKTFDTAATLKECHESSGKRQEKDCKVQVDYSFLLPAPPENENENRSELETVGNGGRCSRLESMEENHKPKPKLIFRRETTKINCLIDEEYSRLLLHPLIHSFLKLKWHKARIFYLPRLICKIILVVLFSSFVTTSHLLSERWRELFETKIHLRALKIYNQSNVTLEKYAVTESKALNESLECLYSREAYTIIAVLAAIIALMELLEILRAPKQQLMTVDPWLSFVVWGLMYKYWPATCLEIFFMEANRTIVALSILLAWISVWMDMGRFPKVGLTIRVFLKVLKNFTFFILPHFCLLIGFGMSLSIIFYREKEYKELRVVFTKLLRVMAGDITMASTEDYRQDVFDFPLTSYIYTAYVLVVSIVMMNLLIGLAVNDIREINAVASTDVLVKQSIMISVLETSLDGKWTRAYLPNVIFAKWINLFPSRNSQKKTITFSPNDTGDSLLSDEDKNALFGIARVNAAAESRKQKRGTCMGGLVSSFDILQKLSSISSTEENEEQQMLVESMAELLETVDNINTLKSNVNNLSAVLLTYFENRMSKF